MCFHFYVCVCVFFLYFDPVDLITIERVQQSKSIQGEKKTSFVLFFCYLLVYFVFPIEFDASVKN